MRRELERLSTFQVASSFSFHGTRPRSTPHLTSTPRLTTPCLPTQPPPWDTSETTLHFYCVPSSDYLSRRWDLRALGISRLCNYEENDPLWCDAAVGSCDCPCEAAGQLWHRQPDPSRVETLGLGWAGRYRSKYWQCRYQGEVLVLGRYSCDEINTFCCSFTFRRPASNFLTAKLTA